MAIVRTIHEVAAPATPHPTEADCTAQVAIDESGRKLLTLVTYGSKDRQIPGKVSQAIQFDKDAATQLLMLIRKTFPDLN